MQWGCLSVINIYVLVISRRWSWRNWRRFDFTTERFGARFTTASVLFLWKLHPACHPVDVREGGRSPQLQHPASPVHPARHAESGVCAPQSFRQGRSLGRQAQRFYAFVAVQSAQQQAEKARCCRGGGRKAEGPVVEALQAGPGSEQEGAAQQARADETADVDGAVSPSARRYSNHQGQRSSF